MGRAARGPVARQTRLQRDQRELLTHLGAGIGQELAPEPIATRERAVHELAPVRDLLQIAELHRAQALNRSGLEREQQSRLLDALSAQCPGAVQDRETQRVPRRVVAAPERIANQRRALVELQVEQSARKLGHRCEPVAARAAQYRSRELWQAEAFGVGPGADLEVREEQPVELVDELKLVEARWRRRHRGALF